MIDTKNCAKNEVKDTERQYGLPETNEMEAERYATEDRGASYSLEFRGTGICFFNKNTLRYKNIKKSAIIFITALCSLCSHDQ
jgi:hypothetical protein